jgi:hypothetical protein
MFQYIIGHEDNLDAAVVGPETTYKQLRKKKESSHRKKESSSRKNKEPSTLLNVY